LFVSNLKTRKDIMVTVNTNNPTGRSGRAVAIQLGNKDLRQTSRNAMILLSIVILGTAMATHASAAEHMGGMGGGLGLGGGFHGGHMSHEFQPPVLNEGPAMSAPTFNPSQSYTLPQSPETPVSPASPGSVFGN
jgi:hypothetical protein